MRKMLSKRTSKLVLFGMSRFSFFSIVISALSGGAGVWVLDIDALFA